jgi:hypothetical protein
MVREELNRKLNLAMAIFMHEAQIPRSNDRIEDPTKSFTPGERARVVHAYLDTNHKTCSVGESRYQVYQKLKGMVSKGRTAEIND